MRVNEPDARVLSMLLMLVMFPSVRPTSNGGTEGQTVSITVDDPRPLAAAVEAIEKRYGWVITYEDPAYVNLSDMADLTHRVRTGDDPTKPRVFGVRGGLFTFNYTAPVGPDSPQAPALLNALLEQHHMSGNPGLFRLIQTRGTFHVLPSMRKNAVGILEVRGSILDAPISVMGGEQSSYEVLQAIVEAVSRSSGVRVVLGTVPMNLLARVPVQSGASNETARTVLLRTLEDTRLKAQEGTESKLSWQLLCDPTPPGLYALNVHAVRGVSQIVK